MARRAASAFGWSTSRRRVLSLWTIRGPSFIVWGQLRAWVEVFRRGPSRGDTSARAWGALVTVWAHAIPTGRGGDGAAPEGDDLRGRSARRPAEREDDRPGRDEGRVHPPSRGCRARHHRDDLVRPGEVGATDGRRRGGARRTRCRRARAPPSRPRAQRAR